MKIAVLVLISLSLIASGCSSPRQTAKADAGQADVNQRHWQGTTGVLNGYRLPDNTKPAPGNNGVESAKRIEAKRGD